MAWSTWLILGLVLLIGEIVTPGTFFLMFFAFGALLTGVVVALVSNVPNWFDWVLFSVASILSLVFFRGRLLSMVGAVGASKDDNDSVVGQQGVASEQIVFRGEGRIELRGSPWRARNVGAATIEKGAAVVVRRVDSLTLEVEAV